VKSSRIEKTVERLHLIRDGKPEEIVMTEDDNVFVTLGSMTAGSSLGSMTRAPSLGSKETGGSWTLWESLAKNQADFGRPTVFDDYIDESQWESFTVTLRDPTFFTLMENLTRNKAEPTGMRSIPPCNLSVVLPCDVFKRFWLVGRSVSCAADLWLHTPSGAATPR
jgi:oleate hydratase